ncbi:ComEA family DNA-binding protein [Collinsella sp. AGMB00827]|uniref:ComEA family DNA-binding protein n=1 Tax=Collinsella ureilytica TaxID=2869515 RepID=A0ABS7MKS7_9ACTN|nr:ComEA family DNA-binding protein [Collinsella urealyticum]MBY4797964.1 ComEA family DNA-binding protein [Collinsella urealyticum]
MQVPGLQSKLTRRIRLWIRKHLPLSIMLAVGLLLALGFGIGSALNGSGRSLVIERNRDEEAGSSSERASGREGSGQGQKQTDDSQSQPLLLVDIGGAVMNPGLVRIAAGSRVAAAIDAAGGLVEDADIDAINQAAPVADGQKIIIPKVGEIPPEASQDQGAQTRSSASQQGSDLININSADASELETLPGIGPATAAAIVDDRNQRGPFATIEDIMRVSGIGQKRFEKLKARIIA